MFYCVDFETEGIEGNPLVNPPRPVGVSIKRGDGPSVYHTGEDMVNELSAIWNELHNFLFHNAPFDLSVAYHWLKLPKLHWTRVHDTTFLIYLKDPHAPSLGLKPSAERILGWKPQERDELQDWIIANVRGANLRNWGAYICEAPVELVGKYAEMDTDMTYALYTHLIDGVPRPAYDLERELQPYLTEATQRGIRVDRDKLGNDWLRATDSLDTAQKQIYKRLDCEFDIHNSTQLADALDKAGKVTEWKFTPTGKRSTARDNLMSAVNDLELLDLLSYVGALRTCANTFMKPWLTMSESTGRLHPSWNQVRNDDYGTRTGRLSCSKPNLQNVPKPFNRPIPSGCVPIPEMRDYLLPEEGDRWISRDFSAQEVRLLAHFEGGELLGAFIDEPDMDPHQLVVDRIKESTGIDVSRALAKAVAFGIIYGMGANGLATQTGLNIAEADELIKAYHAAFPGVAMLQAGTKARGRAKKDRVAVQKMESRLKKHRDKKRVDPKFLTAMEGTIKRRRAALAECSTIRTVNGRLYEVEDDKIDAAGHSRSFEYKLLNYLIQGSAADQTKLALVQYFKQKPAHETFLCTVHDEINISSNIDSFCLKDAMELSTHDIVDAPMTTTLETGETWGAIQ